MVELEGIKPSADGCKGPRCRQTNPVIRPTVQQVLSHEIITCWPVSLTSQRRTQPAPIAPRSSLLLS
jgi:hypothetical protein